VCLKSSVQCISSVSDSTAFKCRLLESNNEFCGFESCEMCRWLPATFLFKDDQSATRWLRLKVQVGNHLPEQIMSHPRRRAFSSLLLWAHYGLQWRTSFITEVTVIYQYVRLLQIPVATLPKAWVCGRSLAGTAVCVLWITSGVGTKNSCRNLFKI